MSEYSKFLQQFNNSKNSEDENLSANEDIITVKDGIKENKKVDENRAVSYEDYDTDDSDVFDAFSPDNVDSIPADRFIKTNETPFVSAKGEKDDNPTSVEKYTDRLLPRIPRKKVRTGYTGKINTYTANHSPEDKGSMFIPVKEAEKEEKEVISEENEQPVTISEKTKVIPKISVGSEEDSASFATQQEAVSDKTRQITAKGDLLREIAKTSGTMTDEDADQLRMDGFSPEDNEDIPDITAEEEALEKELSQVREKRIKNFRFWSKSAVMTGESEDKSFSAVREEKKLPGFLSEFAQKFSHLNTDFIGMGDEEYTDPSRRKEIFAKLIAMRKSIIMKTLILGALGVLLLIINVAASVTAAMNNGFFTILGGSVTAYNIINFVILLAAGGVMFEDLKKGAFSVLKIRPKTDSALLFLYAGAVVQNIASFFTVLKPESDYHLFSGAVVILCVPVLLAKVFYYDSTRHCFKAVAATCDKCYLRKVSDEKLVASLLKDNSNTETNVVYAGKTRFITGFLARSAKSAFAGQASSRIIALTMLLAIIACLAGFIKSGSIVYALGCFTGTIALSFPVSCLLLTGYAISNENSNLSVKTSFVESFADAYNFCCIDDIIVDSSEVFSAEIVSVASAVGVNEKQAQFCAAALTRKTDGILNQAFSGFLTGFEDRFPDADNLLFEDKLGYSAWISDCKVLLGTKDFLLNHNVELPVENTVPFVLGENTLPLFLAIEGQFAAVFSVKYSCDGEIADSLCDLAKNGANILMRVKDPNISEEFGEILLGLPANSLRLINSVTYEKFSAQKNTVTDSEDTGIVFSDSFRAFARTVASAIKLEKLKRVAKLFCEAGAVAGALFGIILTVTGANSGITGWLAVILQMFWIALSFFTVPAVAATSLKEKIHLPENLSARLKAVSAGVSYNDIYDTDEDETTEEESNEEGNGEESSVSDAAEQEIIQQAAAEDEYDPSQLTMEMPVYDDPPEAIDFSLITGEENKQQEEEIPSDDEFVKQTVSDELLDMYADASEASKKTPAKVSSPVNKKRKLFDRIKSDDRADASEDTEKNVSAGRSILSFIDEKLPSPPRFELGRKKEKEEEPDPFAASFVPPENTGASKIYKDEYFASYVPGDDDSAFADVRRKREEREKDEGEFDFWTIKED